MKTISALRDSRKYFLTFIIVGLLIFMYLRVDEVVSEPVQKIDLFIKWCWVVMAVVGGYMGANALQAGLLGGDPGYGSNNQGDTIIINKDKPEIPDEK